MKNNQKLDALIRSMDAAEQSPAPNLQRSRNDLEQILRSPQTSMPSGRLKLESATPRPRRRRRALALGAMAAATTAGFLVAPALSGGDPAFATWTATPGELIGTERDNAVSDCLRSSQGAGNGMYLHDLAEAEVAIAEKRGAWTTVVLTGGHGFEATCTTDTTAPWFKKGSIGSVGNPGNGKEPTAREVRATQLGTGVISDNPLSMASGQVGPEVAAITYIRATGERIKATVSKGQFALWFPGSELTNSSDHAVPVEVTYNDNTTETRHLSL